MNPNEREYHQAQLEQAATDKEALQRKIDELEAQVMELRAENQQLRELLNATACGGLGNMLYPVDEFRDGPAKG